ncbi:MAG: hypothetical protein AAGA12_09635 [Pseudomonadota bacterium]
MTLQDADDPNAERPNKAAQKSIVSIDRPKKPQARVKPPAAMAKPRRRHRLIFGSFLLIVVLPALVSAWYLYVRAADQYASSVGFFVHSEDSASSMSILGGLTQLSSSSTSDSDVLNEFIQSQDMVQRVNARVDLATIYSKPEGDPVFAFDPTGTIEDLTDYWNRVVRIFYDSSTGLIELRIHAFTPQDALLVAQTIFDESSEMINELTAIAREDGTRYALDDLKQAEARLSDARTRLTAFRNRTQIVDPNADIQGQMGLLQNMQSELAATLIDLDLLRNTTRDNDPRIAQAQRRIEVIEKRIIEEREKLGFGGIDTGETNYATTVSEFERLAADREFAEQAYATSLASYEVARSEALRKSRYLAAFIKPTLAEQAEYPQREVLLFLVTLFAFLGWSVTILIYYSIRDRR